MSVIMKPTCTKVFLRATREHPRRLTIELSAGKHIYVYAFGPGKSWQPIVSCNASFDRTTLYPKWSSLVIGDAHFALTEAEATEVELVFAPLGMKVDHSEPRG